MKRCGGVVLGGLLILALMAGTGCTYVQRGAALGAGGGALVGGIWAANAGILSAGEGAAVGAAAGGLVGALAGDQFRQKKIDELNAEIDNLNAQIAAKEGLISQKDDSLKQLQEDLARKEKELNDQLQQLALMNQKVSDKDTQMSALKSDYDNKLRDLKSMEDQLRELEVQLQKSPKGLELTLLNEVLFASGSDELTSRGISVLNQVAAIIRQHFPEKGILVEGHTDDVEIKQSGWKSNWELGAARSLSVLHYLVDQQNFPPAEMGAITYSKYRPVVANSTDDARAKNRRAVIVILPDVEQNYKNFMAE